VTEGDVLALFPLATITTRGGSKELELHLALFQDKGAAANKSKLKSGGQAAGTKADAGGKNKSLASCMKKNFDATHARAVGVFPLALKHIVRLSYWFQVWLAVWCSHD
jgi:hypothetical protein